MIILNIILLLLILSFLVLVHEFGHYLFAKLAKVHIYEFAIGMGPLVKSKIGKDGVQYSIRALPIGGYVAMAGEVYEDDEDSKVPKESLMCNKNWLQRVSIIVAGVVFNFILAILLLIILALFWGAPNQAPLVVDVVEDSAIFESGIVKGDLITHINGEKVTTIDAVQMELLLGDKVYEFTVETKDGDSKTYDVEPKIEENEDGQEVKTFGVAFDSSRSHGIWNSIKYGFTKFVSIMDTMVITIVNLFTGDIPLNQLTGPVGMYTVVEQSASMGIANVIYLTAFISVNLGFLNILPIPAFDGGRLLFLVIEKIKGSRINPELENKIHLVFFGLLLLLMLYITFQDILKFF